MMKFFEKLFRKQQRAQYKYIFVEELPKRVRHRRVYILLNQGYAWQLNLLCPCGCKVLLFVNLIPEVKPSWQYSIDSKGRLTLYPSIYRRQGCESHFFLTDSKIKWV